MFALVTADYPDPVHEAAELFELSNKYHAKEVILPSTIKDQRVALDKAKDEESFCNKVNTIYYYLLSISE